MRRLSLKAAIFVIGLALTGCGSEQQTHGPVNGNLGGEYWAKENLDLQRVGDLLERSENLEEFEAYLNEDDGINNLDLNGDGYVDYISVDEFENRGDYERGLSMYCRFGPDDIQEIGEIVFYREDLDYPGARVFITGNEQIYGDNYYYETNWLERTVELVSLLFRPRDKYYRSPYYYDNYPPDYVAYEVVDTPVYRTRIERIYPQPVFVYTTAPTFVERVKIRSPHRGRKIDRVYARLAKPTREQLDFIRNNPRREHVAKPGRDSRPDRGRRGDRPGRPDFAPQPVSNPGDFRGHEPGRGGPPRGFKVERPNARAAGREKFERPRAQPAPNRIERPKANPGRPARGERPNFDPGRPGGAEKPRMAPSRPAKAEQPRIKASKPGNAGQRGGRKGKKP